MRVDVVTRSVWPRSSIEDSFLVFKTQKLLRTATVAYSSSSAAVKVRSVERCISNTYKKNMPNCRWNTRSRFLEECYTINRLLLFRFIIYYGGQIIYILVSEIVNLIGVFYDNIQTWIYYYFLLIYMHISPCVCNVDVCIRFTVERPISVCATFGPVCYKLNSWFVGNDMPKIVEEELWKVCLFIFKFKSSGIE